MGSCHVHEAGSTVQSSSRTCGIVHARGLGEFMCAGAKLK